MPDNLSKRGAPDSKRINLREPWEVQYWCDKFDCTQSQLKKDVDAVGDSVAAVKKQLAK